MQNKYIIGIDLGGTKISGGIVEGKNLAKIISQKVKSEGSVDDVLQQIFEVADELMNDSVSAIGVGVPGIVDAKQGIVYDVVYIPSWKEVALGKILEERYGVPVVLNNDANCFALGEYYYGKGQGTSSMVGLTLGTGMGAGIIIEKKLYSGFNGGAGEFGMIEYLDKNYEYYASGQFFKNIYNLEGEVVFERAKSGDDEALRLYKELGTHLGKAIKLIMFALDVQLIVLGGSVRLAFPYFSETMLKEVETFAFQNSIHKLRIEASELQNSGILGAAALYLNARTNSL